MNPMILAAIIGGGLGLLKGMGEKKAAKKQNLYNAAMLEYAPWTGYQDRGLVNAPSPLYSAGQGALGGAAFGQGIMQNDLAAEKLSSLTDDNVSMARGLNASEMENPYTNALRLRTQGLYQ